MPRRLLFACWLLLAPVAWAADDGYALPAPVRGEYAVILGNKTSGTMVFEYEGRQAITIIDFPTLAEQGRMFNRVVALIERIGAPRGRVMSNEELAQFIRSVGKTEATLAYGNDFLVAELVVFYNLADLGGIRLNEEELALRQQLLDRRLMVMRTGFYQAVVPQAVILSVPQIGAGGGPAVTELARRTILSHEISHAEYYTNPLYANFCRHFWRSVMTEGQRAAFRKFLSTSSYDPNNEEMMINEAQAYLMYTPDPRAFSPKLVGLGEKDIMALRKRFREGFPDAPPPAY
ncbi:MAG: hypothetical protein OHM77_09455 [Candidatus Nitricoxidivorans perseverans]|uniref:Peptidase MA-like domain-containing protein n=1 Tax=Candidatus Nitricoxidivorans perseverans TaxID=2975601 RepID=A0AA49FJP0_9PROT|nr:MAG: hypothetical protein OHM77_09455 [Candidatus Nitricoxidivorans perseverans]